MVEFLTTMQVASTIETIIRKAKSDLTIISPYLRISDTFLDRLADADDKNVPMKIIFGKDELKEDEIIKLRKISNLELFFCENLHAKCYYNESMMVITSMNFHEFSQKGNREMGIKITKLIESDRKVYDDAVEEVESILKKSNKRSIKTEKKAPTVGTKITKKDSNLKSIKFTQKGYCIRCREEIELNSIKPYCYDCFSVWNEFQNYGYIESYCHSCGKYDDTSMNKPVCYHCYKKAQS